MRTLYHKLRYPSISRNEIVYNFIMKIIKSLQELDEANTSIHQKIATRIKALRTESGATQQKIASILRVKQNTYSQYENGQRQLPLEALVRLAIFYDVSSDYILGLTETEYPYPKN